LARKILLADDSVTAQNMGRRILTDAGYEVTTVNNGSAALKKIAESKPDLIVLDVYMPGYGGLEVCQRIRESEETARIPVLLTVGKLEPFKAEEARRVRADAFVVKPFEASELLTALTKLEDKIVPPPQAHRPSRSAVPTKAIEQMSAGKSFGDAETGWKNRLTIPPPHQKPTEDRYEEAQAPVEPMISAMPETVAALAREKTPERNVSSGMGDITPDEIAAITAAAAAFSTGSEEPFAKLVSAGMTAVEEKPVAAPEPRPEPVADSASVEMGATFASAPEISIEPEPEPPVVAPVEATPAEVPVEPAETAVAEVAPEPVAEVSLPEIPVIAEVASPNLAPEAVETGKLGTEEVAAALASLPGDGVVESVESQPEPTAVVSSGPESTGPRWIVEAVALKDDEAGLVLEQEMIKAQAAMAASAGEAPSAPATQIEVAPEQNLSVSQAEVASSLESPAIPESSPQPEESLPLPVAVIAEESPVDAVAAQAETAPVEASVAEVKEEAFAASAAAGAAPESISTADAISHAGATIDAPQGTPSPVSAPVDRARESELAAAWASWKQVRDSVASPQFASQLADVAAAGLTDAPASPSATSETPAQPEMTSEAAAGAQEESGNIASIVDSVLAELKPKLMEEIAKKIKKDK
jgi:twitching motility two-component system response regulator PilH